MLLDRVFQNRLRIVFGTLCVSLFVGLGGLFVEITPDNRVFYGKNSSQYSDLLKFEDTFEVNSAAVFAVTSTKSILDSLAFRESISWLESNAHNVRNFVRSSSLGSLPFVAEKNGELVVEPLLEYHCSEVCSEEASNTVFKDQYVGKLVSPDGLSATVIALVDVDPKALEEVTLTQRSIEALAEEFSIRYPELELTVTGAVPMMQAFVDTAAADSASVLAIAFLVIFVFLCFATRSLKIGMLVFATGALACGVAMGVAGWAGIRVNTATSVVPVIVFTLVIAGAMHLVIHYLHRFSDGHLEEIGNAKASFRAQFVPMNLAALTSGISLLSLLTVTSPPIRELGLLSAIGVFAGALLSFLFLGLLLPSIRVDPWKGWHLKVREFLNSLARTSEFRRLPSLAVLLVFLLLGIGNLRLVIDDDFIRYFDQSVKFRQDVEQMIALEIASPYHLEIVLSESQSALNPSTIQYMRKLEKELRSDEHVLNVSSILDVLDDLKEVLAPEVELDNPDVISQLFLSYEMSLPVGQTTRSVVSSSQDQLRMSVMLKDVSSMQTKTVERKIYSHHQEAGPQGTRILVTGENIPVAHLSQDNIEEMLKGLFVCLFLISTLIALTIKRSWVMVLGLVAITIPIAAGFGLWGWTVGSMGLSAAIILAATIGVVIDDAIHIIYRYEDGRRSMGLAPKECASYAIHKVGPAVVITSICLSLGFALLWFSSYGVNQVFGVAACLIFALAMIFDLIVLPKLLAFQRSR